MTTVAGTSYPQRQTLRALGHACRRAGDAVPARKLLTGHEGKLGKLIDLGLVQRRQDGETRVHRTLMGSTHEYVEWVYEPTEAGHALLARTEGESAPSPAPLRDEHMAVLRFLGQAQSPHTAGRIASHVDRDLTVRQIGSRLALLARHGFADSIDGDYMAPTRWVITPAGREALR